jgi:cytoskeleton protein RodZ
MPLDTGDVDLGSRVPALSSDELAALRPTAVKLDEQTHLGSALATARRSLDLAVEDIASATRVRTRYVIAIEAFDFDALPARPFVIGYVRAYAMALGLDADAVVARFRAEAPPVPDDLKPPVGVERRKPLAPRIVGVVALTIVVAVVAWNVWRHAEAAPLHALPPPPQAMPTPSGPVSLGAPLPTPPEASTPPVYQTPGLPSANAQAAPATVPPAPVAAQGAPFVSAGAVYGAAAPGGGVILQARTATPLVVRGPGGAVYFARQLAVGEAWRAPASAGLTADVGSPSSVEVFVGGVSRGVLTQPQTPLSTISSGSAATTG